MDAHHAELIETPEITGYRCRPHANESGAGGRPVWRIEVTARQCDSCSGLAEFAVGGLLW